MARVLVSYVSPFPDKLTGISTYTWRILEALGRHGQHDYVLATNWSPARVPPEIAAAGVEIVHRPVPINETAMLLRNTIELPRLQRELGASVIFHPQPTSMIARMADSVVVLHDLYRVTHPELYRPAQRLQWRFGIAAGFRRAGALIAVSDATRQAAVEAYPDVAAKTTVVHEASPLDLPDEPIPPLGEEAYALVVANVTPNKNVGVLFEALAKLAGAGWRPRVKLVGRDDAGLLDDLEARFPQGAVERLGSVSDTELTRLYAQAAVYINTSLVEGFCLPILEAHTLGVPVICADIPVLREVAGEGALFFDPRDPALLADAVQRVMTDATFASTMRDRALANAARFSWEKAAGETEAVFDNLMMRRRRAGSG